MTTPDERRRSIKYAREFLVSLIDPKKTPRVPKIIRQMAISVLRHYPWDLYLESKQCWWCGRKKRK